MICFGKRAISINLNTTHLNKQVTQSNQFDSFDKQIVSGWSKHDLFKGGFKL
jgi:hypothetical protein